MYYGHWFSWTSEQHVFLNVLWVGTPFKIWILALLCFDFYVAFVFNVLAVQLQMNLFCFQEKKYSLYNILTMQLDLSDITLKSNIESSRKCRHPRFITNWRQNLLILVFVTAAIVLTCILCQIFLTHFTKGMLVDTMSRKLENLWKMYCLWSDVWLG